MSLFVNAALFMKKNSIIENKKQIKEIIMLKQSLNQKMLNYLQYLLMMMILLV